MSQGTQEHLLGRFEAPEFLRGLDADAAAALITAAADVVLVVDGAGVIQDLAFGSEDLLGHGYHAWIGQPWTQTVTVESKPKVEALLKEADAGRQARWRHINHPGTNGTDLPLSYSVVPFRGPTTSGGRAHALAFGRDLRAQAALQQRVVSAQQSMERDYWRLRQIETRYRLLFQVASEAVLIVDASSDKLEEANPAAYACLGEGIRRPGWTVLQSMDAASADTAGKLLTRLRANGRAEPVAVRLADEATHLTLAASLFRQENTSHILIRLTPAQPPVSADADRQRLVALVESAPDAFVVTDLEGRVLTTNQAFLDLAQLANEALARGEPLDRWLGKNGVDLNVLVTHLRQRGSVRLFATSLRGEFGSTLDVEISAVAVTEGEQPCMGFIVRDVGRRLGIQTLPAAGLGAAVLPRSPGQMAELVGRVPLKDIVRETTDLIEQMCIESALQLTNDNRASAAEMLGLSRQSLYVKLRRFGISDNGSDPA